MRAAKAGPVDAGVLDALAAIGGDDGASFSRASKVSDKRVEMALRFYDNAQIDEQLTEWSRTDRARAGKGKGGRPSVVTARQIITLLTILVLEDTPPTITRARDLLVDGLSPVGQRLIGLDPKSASESQWYDRLWRARQRFLKPLDPEPYDGELPGGRRKKHTRSDYEAMVARRDPEECDEKLRRIDWVANRLVEATLQEVPKPIMDEWKGDGCVDATLVEAFSHRGNRLRDPKPDDVLSVEPSAGYYKGGLEWGWDLHISTMASPIPRAVDLHPMLVTGISMVACSAAPGKNGAKALLSAAERGHPTGDIAPDRAYFPEPKPEHFQIPLRLAGYGLVGDYKKKQLGVQPGHDGVPLVDGSFSCPHMPQPLKDALKDYWVDATIDEATYKQRIQQRTKYLFRAKEKPQPGKAMRMMCPAAGASSTVNCTLRRDVPFEAGRPTVRADEPVGACCTKNSINIPFEAGAKHRQDLQYGTPVWLRTYNSARNGVESFNGAAKAGDWAALGDPTRRRSRGYANQFLASTLMIASVNFHKLYSFLKKTRDQTFVDFKKRPALRRPGYLDTDEPIEVFEPARPASTGPPAAA